MSTTLDKVRALFRNEQLTAEQGYARTVADTVAGKAITENAIAAAIKAAGKSLADFERDVQALTEKTRRQAEAGRRPALEAESAVIDGKIAAAEAELEKAVAAIRDKARPWHERKRAIADELAVCQRAEAALETAYPADGPLRAARAAACRRALAAQQRRGVLIPRADAARSAVRAAEAALAEQTDRGRRMDTNAQNARDAAAALAAARDQLAAAEADLADAEAERTEASAEAERLAAEMVGA